MNRYRVFLASLVILAIGSLCEMTEPCFAQWNPNCNSACSSASTACPLWSFCPLFCPPAFATVGTYPSCQSGSCSTIACQPCGSDPSGLQPIPESGADGQNNNQRKRPCCPTCQRTSPIPSAQAKVQVLRTPPQTSPLLMPPTKVSSRQSSKLSSLDRSKVVSRTVELSAKAGHGISRELVQWNQDWTPVESPTKVALRGKGSTSTNPDDY